MVNSGIALLALAGPALGGIVPNKGNDEGHSGYPGHTPPTKWPATAEPHWVTRTATYLTTTCPVSHTKVTSGTKTLTIPITLTSTITVTTTTVEDSNTETRVVVPTGTVPNHPL
ncbi:hypothetical protein KXX64_001230, partial [Aspergillus fumigatus]